MKNKDIKITMHFGANEMPDIDQIILKYYGGRPFKTQKDRKRYLEMFCGTMFNKGAWAVENDKEYMEVN
jgi:hypothetical protein